MVCQIKDLYSIGYQIKIIATCDFSKLGQARCNTVTVSISSENKLTTTLVLSMVNKSFRIIDYENCNQQNLILVLGANEFSIEMFEDTGLT